MFLTANRKPQGTVRTVYRSAQAEAANRTAREKVVGFRG
jgi:hypothetical protein